MNPRFERLLGRTPGGRRGRLIALLALVLLVPLAVAGFVSGALGGAGTTQRIPAIVVNNDVMQTTTDADGNETPVLAGRLLVTELTGASDDEAAGFDWTISNDAGAAEALEDGTAYAVLTIPADFSESVLSMSGAEPQRADLSIRTDDAHGYLAGSVVQSIGTSMTAAFGQQLTETYLQGFYGNLAALGGQLGDAADGAAQLSSGVTQVADGLGQLADGAVQSADGADALSSGATQLSGGISQYTDGVDRLSAGLSAYAPGVAEYTGGVDGIAAGLAQLDAGVNDPATGGLDALSSGVEQYTGTINGGLAQVETYVGPAADEFDAWIAANRDLVAEYPELQEIADQVAAARTGVDQLQAAGTTLATQTRSTLGGVKGAVSQLSGGLAEVSAGSPGIRDGVAAFAAGAGQLASGSVALESGASGLAGGTAELAGGLDTLATGAQDAADGAGELEGGATQLADGLADGAESAKALDSLNDETAAVLADPVGATTERDNEIGSLGEVIGMLFVPVGLWLGALALVLAYRPVTAAALASTASTGRIAGRALLRAGLVGLGQAVVVTALLHLAMGVPWSAVGATLPFAMLTALSFTALHVLLRTALGKFGLIASLLLVTVQLTSAGGLYPIEIVSGPFQAISPLLPLTWGVAGMQAIIAGTGGAAVAGPALVLVLFGAIGAVGTLLAVSRQRGIRSLAFAPLAE
ncbi:YhgE/Pip family protein [Agromyces seonyuensis]|uniref:YhgE/Pip domain-containing protein n=1 Tax=Agromyces seonyuensis TaxID=2662446 RepID=A0A6I4P2F2_9MICO|nr:YhgE/Pip domain-containing protein [Agromyces seonyuensis]MWB98259.1 YhgE/Pip domain-containing protein [Agromyces seonyuensis]